MQLRRILLISAAALAPLAALTPLAARADEADRARTVRPLTVTAPSTWGEDDAQARDQDLRPGAGPAVLEALERRVPGLGLVEAQANPYQPNLSYRGFEASPLQGSPQGLAVYVDGVRFNQPFGDTVDFDLIPEAAVRSAALAPADPAFGLNALGGAVTLRLKTGFSDPGGEAEVSAGSFGRRHAEASYGASAGRWSGFLAATAHDEDGWRVASPSRVRQLYGDLGWRDGPLELHAGLIAADNRLTGNGPAPVELLAADRAAVFTHPDETRNRFGLVRLWGDWRANPLLTVRAQAYAGRLRQATRNGDATDAEPCEDDEDLLCLEEDGPQLTGPGGPIAAFLGDGPYAQLNATRTRTDSGGAAVQFVMPLRGNSVSFGASLDASRTRFSAASLLGALTEDRGFGGPGAPIDMAEGPITAVELTARTAYAAAYASDVVRLGPRTTLTLSGRYNHAQTRLRDGRGEALNGDHRFQRLNLAASLSQALGNGLRGRLGYAETNRAPTPAELSCASPEAPCSLTNFFVADPPLKQVTARTVSAGLDGAGSRGGVQFAWRAELYRAATSDDISYVASAARGRGYFQNVGRTRRQGAELSAELARGGVDASLGYAFTDATFRAPLTLASPDNPAAEDGRIDVAPGDRLPGVARHRLKLALAYDHRPWRVAASLIGATGAALAGDEANLTPPTARWLVANLSGAWRIGEGAELFADVRNLADTRYATFGTFTETGAVDLAEAPGARDPRSLSPGAPRSIQLGLRMSF